MGELLVIAKLQRRLHRRQLLPPSCLALRGRAIELVFGVVEVVVKFLEILRHVNRPLLVESDGRPNRDGATIRSITVGNGVANNLASNLRVKSIVSDTGILDQLLDGSLSPTGLLACV